MGKLVVLMITAFVDMVGLLMIMPLLPFYAKSFGASGLHGRTARSRRSPSRSSSARRCGDASPTSTDGGRRCSSGWRASAIAYVIFAYSNSLWLLFLSRLVQGAGGGTVSVIQAYVADALKPEDRAKGLGWLSAATNPASRSARCSAVVTLGAGIHAPGLFAASLCVVNMGFAWKFLVESRDMVEARSVQESSGPVARCDRCASSRIPPSRRRG